MRNRKHDIEKYLKGELSSAEMYALEKEALSDPFLAEALEGVEQTGADNFLYDLHQLNRSVHDRMRRKGRKNNKVIRLWGWTAAVAATLLLLAVSGFIAVTLLRDQHARNQAMNTPQTPPPDANAKVTDTLTVVMPSNEGPRARADAKQETSTTQESTKPSRRAQAYTPPQNTSGDRAVTKGTEITQDVTPDQGFLAKDESDVATQPADEIARAEAENITTQEDSPAARNESVKEQELSKALEGKVAGLESRETKKRSAPATAGRAIETTLIKGNVRSQDGEGLPGVNVFVEGTNTGTVTDAQGNFQLAVPADSTRLQFSFIGFESKVVKATPRDELHVTLDEDVASLSEVVVTGYASGSTSSDPEPFRFAEPDGGRSDFKKYLDSAVKYPVQAINNKVEGKVTIRFAVEPSGQLTDFDVVKGIGSGCEEELIRAIREGPAWKPSRRGDQPVRDKVSVRYKFKLPE